MVKIGTTVVCITIIADASNWCVEKWSSFQKWTWIVFALTGLFMSNISWKRIRIVNFLHGIFCMIGTFHSNMDTVWKIQTFYSLILVYMESNLSPWISVFIDNVSLDVRGFHIRMVVGNFGLRELEVRFVLKEILFVTEKSKYCFNCFLNWAPVCLFSNIFVMT